MFFFYEIIWRKWFTKLLISFSQKFKWFPILFLSFLVTKIEDKRFGKVYSIFHFSLFTSASIQWMKLTVYIDSSSMKTDEIRFIVSFSCTYFYRRTIISHLRTRYGRWRCETRQKRTKGYVKIRFSFAAKWSKTNCANAMEYLTVLLRTIGHVIPMHGSAMSGGADVIETNAMKSNYFLFLKHLKNLQWNREIVIGDCLSRWLINSRFSRASYALSLFPRVFSNIVCKKTTYVNSEYIHKNCKDKYG